MVLQHQKVSVSKKDNSFDIISGPAMLKAQVPIGGRGKTGGVLDLGEGAVPNRQIETLFATKVRGYQPKRVLIEEKADVMREFC